MRSDATVFTTWNHMCLQGNIEELIIWYWFNDSLHFEVCFLSFSCQYLEMVTVWNSLFSLFPLLLQQSCTSTWPPMERIFPDRFGPFPQGSLAENSWGEWGEEHAVHAWPTRLQLSQYSPGDVVLLVVPLFHNVQELVCKNLCGLKKSWAKDWQKKINSKTETAWKPTTEPPLRSSLLPIAEHLLHRPKQPLFTAKFFDP